MTFDRARPAAALGRFAFSKLETSLIARIGGLALSRIGSTGYKKP